MQSQGQGCWGGYGGRDAAGHRGVGDIELERSQARVVVEAKNCQAKASGLCPKDWNPGVPQGGHALTLWWAQVRGPLLSCCPVDGNPEGLGSVCICSPQVPRQGRRCPSPDPLGAARTRGHS